MSPIQRNIAIAIALLGLAFYGYKQQLHLPRYVDPFDDQWEMSVPWLRNNYDSIVQGYCNHFHFEISHGTYRIGYGILDGYEDIITGKTLSVLADTVELQRSTYRQDTWGLSITLFDSAYMAKMDYSLLDSVCSTFGYARFDVQPNGREARTRYISSNAEDTISFTLSDQLYINDSTLVRDFYFHQWREASTYQRPRSELEEVYFD